MSKYDKFDEALAGDRWTRVQQVILGCALFLALGLFFNGFIYSVEYRRVPVVDVVQYPGRAANVRLVTVDLGDRQFPVRTSDRLIFVRPGETACLAERGVLGRRWLQYRLALPFYCDRAAYG